jgi:ELWxxDGT repeat protein
MPFSRGSARRGLAGLGFAVLLLLGGVRATESGGPGAAAVAPGPAHLVHDFFPGDFEGERPLPQLTRLGSVLFFLGDDRETGTTVWRTDGTAGGTHPVPLAASAPPGIALRAIVGALGERMLLLGSTAEDGATPLLFAVGGQGEAVALGAYRPRFQDPPVAPSILGARFFYQDCDETRCDVLATDGTPAGTAPVAALEGELATPDQRLAGTFADRWLVFASGTALYAYDVAEGRVRTLLPNGANAGIYPVGGSLFFVGTTGTYDGGYTPLGSDGLRVSTLAAPEPRLLFKDALASAGWHDGTFFFVSRNGRLWSTDGESVSRYTGGVRAVRAFVDAYAALEGGTHLDVIGSTTFLPVPGYYLETLLGIDETKHEVTELHPVCAGKYPCLGHGMSPVTVAGGQAFEGIDRDLWHSDGTPEGTRRLRVLTRPDPASFSVVDGRLVLSAQNLKGEKRLWATDGTAPGTEALSDGGSDRPFEVQGPAVALGGALITAAARKPVGQQLWRIADGRTAPLTGLRHLPSGISPSYAFPFGGDRVILAGREGWTGVTPQGVALHLRDDVGNDVCNQDGTECTGPPVAVGQRLLFAEAATLRLKSTDGTAAGHRNLPLEDADGVVNVVASLGPFRDRALVLGNLGGVWTSDGTPAGTRFVTRLPPEPVSGAPGLTVGTPIAVGDVSYLFRRLPDAGDDTRSALELWRTDGTAAGTVRLASIPFAREAAPFLDPTLFGGKIFFRLLGVLWESDGTAAGTRELPDQLPGGTFSLAAGATRLYAGAGYLNADGPQTLWAIDPATLKATKLATSFTIGAGFPGYPLGNIVGDTLFFLTQNPGGVRRWWRTEGTPESTVLLPDFLARNTLHDFVTAGDRRYLEACDAAHGCELWSTDRLGEDTRLVEDLFPGTRSSDPQVLAVAGHTLWFAGTEPNVGRELWTLELPAAAAAWKRSPAAHAKRAREPQWKRRLR